MAPMHVDIYGSMTSSVMRFSYANGIGYRDSSLSLSVGL